MAWTNMLKNGKKGNKLEMAKQAIKPAAPALKSALKSSSNRKPKKTVTFAVKNVVMSINKLAVWSRPEPSVDMQPPRTYVNWDYGLEPIERHT
ncbi:MAG: hypothetical protein L6R41_004189 [Letrouitia leprolyta]|nr:MAG: hypothetical protein L6R41_004189 [Letrouitia leprolyta]